MSKAHRGAGIRYEIENAGRGKCPVCDRTGIKVVYESTVNGEKVKVCKQCRAKLAKEKSE